MVRPLSRCLSLILLTSIGCKSTIHQEYGFEPIEATLGDLSMHANLRGTDKIDENRNSTRSSPYELWLSIESDVLADNNECYVKLENIKIENTAEGVSLLVSSSEKIKFSNKNNASKAFKIFKELEIPYEHVNLEMSMSLGLGCTDNDFSELVSVQFLKDYSERKIGLWNKLLGI